MAREKKKKEVGTSFAELLKNIDLKAQDRKRAVSEEPAKEAPARARRPAKPPPPRPSSALAGDDLAAFQNAMVGVRRLEERGPGERRSAGPSPVAAVPDAADAVARARLAALVGGGVRFRVERDGDRVRGWRVGTPERAARELEGAGVAPGGTVDLHGLRAAEAEHHLVQFIRRQQGRGVQRVCVVHGKGSHSADGVGVLRDVTVHVLTEGGAAPCVQAFATAPRRLGGSGALIVQLTR